MNFNFWHKEGWEIKNTLTVLFVSCMLIANTIANKQLAIGPWNAPAGILVFPITYILSDIFSEVYGFRYSRRVAWLAFGINLFMVVIYDLTAWLPSPAWFNATAQNTVFKGAFRLLLAGFAAYNLGDWFNDVAFSRMRRRAYDKHGEGTHKGFIKRSLLSSFLGNAVDSTVFLLVAFAGVLPWSEMFTMIVLQFVIKSVYEILASPLSSWCCAAVKALEDIDMPDYSDIRKRGK